MLASLLTALTLTACEGREADGGLLVASAQAAPPVPATTHAAYAAGAEDSFELTFVGGFHSGTHYGSGDLGCFTYGGLWQAAWEDHAGTGLSAFLLQLQDVPAAGGSGTRVTFTAVLGSLMAAEASPALIDVLGSEFGGDGEATVTRDGGAATIRLVGTSPQGSWVTAEFRCATVEEPA